MIPGEMQVFNLEGIAQIAQDLRVDMPRNDQIAADVICHMQTPHHGTNQPNPDKGDALTRAGNSGINRRFCLAMPLRFHGSTLSGRTQKNRG